MFRYFYSLLECGLDLLERIALALEAQIQFNNDWMDFNATIEERAAQWREEDMSQVKNQFASVIDLYQQAQQPKRSHHRKTTEPVLEIAEDTITDAAV